MEAILRSGFLALAILLTAACSENAGSYEDGVAAYQRGNFAMALEIWIPLAERGDADAQNHLGMMHENGHGVPKDDAEAAKWYRKAADQGTAEAQYNLGSMYENGWGVTQDHAEAMKWWRRSAEQGFALAQSKLGFDGSAPKPKAVNSSIQPKRVKTIKIIGPDDPLEPQQFNLWQQAK